jgi:hypothetical protein
MKSTMHAPRKNRLPSGPRMSPLLAVEATKETVDRLGSC